MENNLQCIGFGGPQVSKQLGEQGDRDHEQGKPNGPFNYPFGLANNVMLCYYDKLDVR